MIFIPNIYVYIRYKEKSFKFVNIQGMSRENTTDNI